MWLLPSPPPVAYSPRLLLLLRLLVQQEIGLHPAATAIPRLLCAGPALTA
jgi:hypothetical protein